MNKPGAILSARIRTNLKDLALLVDRAKNGWVKASSQKDDYYLDGVALNLHGFYSGLEKIFEKIAATIDGSVPTAANWHQELLAQMCLEIPDVRPAVISEDLRDMRWSGFVRQPEGCNKQYSDLVVFIGFRLPG